MVSEGYIYVLVCIDGIRFPSGIQKVFVSIIAWKYVYKEH